MSAEERIDKLEQRMAVLEGLVRQLVSQSSATRSAPSRPRPPAEQTRPPSPAPVPMPGLSTPTDPAAPARAGGRAAIDSEQWFGQRGLLAVGVVFLILAAGYLLKLSFERGWVSPAARCTGGTLAGIVVAVIGHRLFRRGLATYGAALIGCGAAIIYLSVWAASRLYQFLPPMSGIVALALISLSLAAIAFMINVEALGTTAALGAFF